MGAAEKREKRSRSSVLTIVERLDELPTLPSIVYELSQMINDPMSSTSDVEKIMGSDPAMTTKVLRMANSAYYAIPGGVSSLQRAIAYIGYDAIHQLVLAASIINTLDAKASPDFDTSRFWKHSLGVAMAAETTARFVHHKAPSDLFTAGLVHDIGKIALYMVEPESFMQCLAIAREQDLSLMEAEEAHDFPRHTMIGRELAVKWRLPAVFQAATAHHHQREMSQRGPLSPEMNLVVDIVYLSNLLIHALQFGHSGHTKVIGAPKEVLERLHLDETKLKALIGEIRDSIASAESFLKIIIGGQ